MKGKRRLLNKGQSEEDLAKKREIEKIKIQRRLKPFIKRRLLEILAKVRKKIEKEDQNKFNLHRPMSIKGVLRRDLFDNGKDEFSSKDKLNKKNSALRKEKKRAKRMKTHNEEEVQKNVEKMEEESSYEMSSVGHSSNDGRIEESKEEKGSYSSNEESSDSEEEKKATPQSKTMNKPMIKTVNKSPYLTTIKLKGKNKWIQKLNISREIIHEVDEEHRSDTTNRMSTCKLMHSSEHKSTNRRFQKVMSTLKGISPNSSMKVLNKELSDSSNPYYEQNDSPYLHENYEEIKVIKIGPSSNKVGKKHSSQNLMKKLDEKQETFLKSDRSMRNMSKDKIKLLVSDLAHQTHEDGDYITKAVSSEIPMINDDDTKFDRSQNNSKSFDKADKSISFCIQEQLERSQELDYIEEVDSPISTGSETYEDFFEDSEDESLEDIDGHDSAIFIPRGEEERKLYTNTSQLSYQSNEFELLNKNRKEVLSADRTNRPKTLRQWGWMKGNEKNMIDTKQL